LQDFEGPFSFSVHAFSFSIGKLRRRGADEMVKYFPIEAFPDLQVSQLVYEGLRQPDRRGEKGIWPSKYRGMGGSLKIVVCIDLILRYIVPRLVWEDAVGQEETKSQAETDDRYAFDRDRSCER
jgi:hypothetical protein